MNRLEHLLTIVGEEGGEVAGRASKAMRFGLNEIQPGQELSNLQRLVGEINDLLAVAELLHDSGIDMSAVGDRAQIAAKKAKVARFLEYSRLCGTLQE